MPPKKGEIEEVAEIDDDQTGESNAEIDDDDKGDKPEKDAEKSTEKDDGEGGEITVAIAGEPAEEESEPAPGWVKELRKSHRQTQKENRELKRKLEATEKKTDEVGEKPVFDDYNLNTGKYESDLTAWYERKREADIKTEAADSEQKQQEQDWQSTLDSYEDSKEKLKLKAKGFDDAEALVEGTFSIAQQGIILNGAEDSALLILAIGSNPKKLKELSAIKDPVKFSFAVAKLETQLKVTPRKAATKPEKQISTAGGASNSADTTLKRLREKAEKTGDYSAVTQYNRDKKRKAS